MAHSSPFVRALVFPFHTLKRIILKAVPALGDRGWTMANIAYTLAGEGRGHATRARTIADTLIQKGHRIAFITGDDGFDFISAKYADHPQVSIVRVPSLRFAYTGRGEMKRVSMPGTIRNSLVFLWNMRTEVDKALRALKDLDFDPDFFLSDYEALAWRMARRLKKPVITLDNQHFFALVRLSELPLSQWPFTLLIGFTCFLITPQKRAVLISKFVPDEYIRERDNVHMIGPLIRPEIKNFAQTEREEDFILCYVRPSVAGHVLDVVRRTGLEARVYGLGERPAEGRMSFHATSADNFARDLVRARKVIGTSGNQLIGECSYLRKSLYVIPEPGQMEQLINAYLARRFGAMMGRRRIEESLTEFLETNTRMDYPFEGDAVEKAITLLEKYIEPMRPRKV
jgi:uncharacterized protein (TIGR00661 family)